MKKKRVKKWEKQGDRGVEGKEKEKKKREGERKGEK